KPSLFQMVQVDVAISPGPDELADIKFALLGDHMSQQRVGGDIEWNTEKYVRRSLIKLAGEFAASDIELKERVALLQSHPIQFADVPGADDQTTGIGICSDLFNKSADLVNRAAISRPPRSPLRAVDRAEFAVLVRPFIPDVHAVVGQIFDVRLAAQKPQQLVDDRFQMKPLRRDHRKAIAQIEAHLVTEDGDRPDACAVAFARAVFERMLH